MKEDLPNRLLRLMADGAWHLRNELVDHVSHRFSATMYTLKKRDYSFERRHMRVRVQIDQHVISKHL